MSYLVKTNNLLKRLAFAVLFLTLISAVYYYIDELSVVHTSVRGDATFLTIIHSILTVVLSGLFIIISFIGAAIVVNGFTATKERKNLLAQTNEKAMEERIQKQNKLLAAALNIVAFIGIYLLLKRLIEADIKYVIVDSDRINTALLVISLAIGGLLGIRFLKRAAPYFSQTGKRAQTADAYLKTAKQQQISGVTTVFCGSCGAASASDAAFCPECGDALG